MKADNRNLLGMPEFRIIETYDEPDGRGLAVHVESIARPKCPYCHSELAPHRHVPEVRKINDMHISGKLVFIYIHTSRFRCQNEACGRTFSEKFEFIDGKKQMTTRMRKDIQEMCLQPRQTFKSISQFYSIAEPTVRRIFDEYCRKQKKLLLYKAPAILGLDETHVFKKMDAVFTDVEHNKFLDIIPGNDSAKIAAFIRKMDGYEKIKVVAMDFHEPYRALIREVLPSARIVADHYHAIQLINKKMNSTRLDLKPSLTDEQKRLLGRGHRLMMKNQEDLTPRMRYALESWFAEFPSMRKPYALKEAFRDIYKAKTRRDAGERFIAWCKSVPDDLPHFVTAKNTFVDWANELMNFFDRRFTNAYTESMNRLIKVLESQGPSSTFEVLRMRFLFSTRATRLPKFRKREAEWHVSGTVGAAYDPSKQIFVRGFGVDITELMKELSESAHAR